MRTAEQILNDNDYFRSQQKKGYIIQFDDVIDLMEQFAFQKSEEERFIVPDNNEPAWKLNAETYDRDEVYKLLYTQRAMISNDLKTSCGNELTKEMFHIINNPRTPKF